MSNSFKYHNMNHYPTETGTIQTSRRDEKYAARVDIAEDLSQSFFSFSEAYYDAAETILERMISKKAIDELDHYIYPVFFLYRQSIELLLKSIGCMFIIEKTDRKVFLNTTRHDLKAIYIYVSGRVENNRPSDEDEWLQSYFSNVSKFDKESDSFRYPFHIKRLKADEGDVTYKITRVFQKQTHINLLVEVEKWRAAREIILNLYLDNSDSESRHISSRYTNVSTNFIEEGGSYFEQSVVGYEYSKDDFYPICSGYHECANFLRNYLLNGYDTNNYDLHKNIYPMCYLYRNASELFLKAIISDCPRISVNDTGDYIYNNKHRITNLFQLIENNILGLYDISNEDAFIKNAKRYCNLLHDFDSDSSKFRYPVNKKCDPYYQSYRYYDFNELSIFLDSLCNALDGIRGELENRQEYIAEMEAEQKQYY